MTVQTHSKDKTVPFAARRESTVFHYSRPVAVFYLVLGVAISAFFVMAVFNAGTAIENRIVSAIGLALFGGVVAVFFTLATTRDAALIVDSTGILISHLGNIKIPWSEISGIRTKRQDWVLILLDVHDPGRFIEPPSTIRAALFRFLTFSFLNGASITVHTLYLKGRTKDILATIEHYRAQAEASSSSRR